MLSANFGSFDPSDLAEAVKALETKMVDARTNPDRQGVLKASGLHYTVLTLDYPEVEIEINRERIKVMRSDLRDASSKVPACLVI
jgi:hypothetical protein